MILVIRPDATLEQLEHILERVKEMGFVPHVSRGETRTIVGIVGNEYQQGVENFPAIPGVENVLPIQKPYKLASREFHKEDTIVYVGDVRIGGGSLALIAGPCAVEDEATMDTIARYVKAGGANILRGGAFKPRTSPYAFQGKGEEGLKILRDIGQKYDLPIVTEVMDPRQVELVLKYADMLQVGARNMQNFDLLREVGRTRMPVLLKRGLSATVKDLLLSAEYILSEGNKDVVLCERGVRSFEDSTRNMLDLAAVPNVKNQCHLPIIVDPSHATGRPELIPSMCRAAVAAGADGVHVEVHNCPEQALSDGPQALRPHQFLDLTGDLRRLAAALGREFWKAAECS